MDKKYVFITGSSGGIGHAIAEKFASSEEYHLILHARKETAEFLEFIEVLSNKYLIDIECVYFDMTDYDAMKKEMQRLQKEKKTIDVLINNAGIAHGGLFQMTTLQQIKDVFEINFFSLIQITQLVCRMMVRKKGGTIVNLASVAGIDLESGNCAYGTSKAAVIAFTKTAAKELAKFGIRMNAVAPGLTDTRMAAQMEENAGKEMLDATAMKRLANPNEIAETVFFLASNNASFITGQVLRVDGGM